MNGEGEGGGARQGSRWSPSPDYRVWLPPSNPDISSRTADDRGQAVVIIPGWGFRTRAAAAADSNVLTSGSVCQIICDSIASHIVNR